MGSILKDTSVWAGSLLSWKNKTKNRLVKWFYNILALGFMLILDLVFTLICGAPMWITFGLIELIGPEGFWQYFALVGVCMFVMGGPQIFLLCVWFVIVFTLLGALLSS